MASKPPQLILTDEVAGALQDGNPVVALESTILSHGLPPGRNLDVARRLERLVRDAGRTRIAVAALDAATAFDEWNRFLTEPGEEPGAT